MKNRRGQGLIEYLILLALISVSAIAVVSTVGTNIKEKYASISSAIRGKKSVSNDTEVKSDAFKGRGMDDFMDSSTKLE